MTTCFWNEWKTIRTVINNSWGYFGLDNFPEKTISCAYLFLSRLKTVFHFHEHSKISSKYLLISLTEMLE